MKSRSLFLSLNGGSQLSDIAFFSQACLNRSLNVLRLLHKGKSSFSIDVSVSAIYFFNSLFLILPNADLVSHVEPVYIRSGTLPLEEVYEYCIFQDKMQLLVELLSLVSRSHP